MTRMKICGAFTIGLMTLLATPETAAAPLLFKPIGPVGGEVRSLARDPGDPRRVYAGTVDGILYVSVNRGASWTRLEPGFPLRGVSLDDLVVTEESEIIASFWKVDHSGGGIAKSSDRGVSFRMIGAGLEGEAVRGLARAPSKPTVMAAVTKTGVFRSTDDGESFTRISPADHKDLRIIGSVAIDPRNENSIMVGTAHLAWRTDNAGKTWRPIQKGMIDDSDVMTLTIDRREPTTVFATACTGIWRSKTGGASWTKVLGIPSVSRRTRAFAQDLNRPDTFYAGTTDGVYISENDAKTFVRTTEAGLVVNSLVSLGGGRVLAGVEGEGILVSTDFGRSWAVSNDGFRERLFREIVPDEPRNRLLALSGADGAKNSALFEQDRSQDLWRRIELPSGREIRSLRIGEKGDLILGTDDGVFMGTAAGLPWTRAALLIDGIDSHPQVEDLHVRASFMLAATNHGLFESRDRGVSWAHLRLGASRSVVAVAVSDAGKVVAATPLAVYARSEGEEFRQVASVGLVSLKRMAFAPQSKTKIYASTSNGLLVTRDAGRSWFHVMTPLRRVTSLAQHKNGETIFASDADGHTVFASSDAGGTFWPLEAQGLPSQRTFALAIFGGGGKSDSPTSLIVAASGGGLLEARIEDSSPGERKKQ